MKLLRDISVRAKLWAGFALAFCLIAAIGLISVLQLRAHNEFATVLAEVTLQEIVLLGDIDRTLAEHKVLATQRVESTDFRQSATIVDAMDAATASAETAMASYAAIADDPRERAHLAALLEHWQGYQESFAQVARNLETAEAPSALRLLESETLPGLEAAGREVDRLLAISRQEAASAADGARRLYTIFLSSIAATLLLAAGALGAAAIWVSRSVSLPIRKVSDAMRSLSEGDDSVALGGDKTRKDEIGTLITAAEAYRDSLIEQRRLAEEAHGERRRLDAAISNMPIGLSMFDSQKRLIVANPRYREMYRLTADLMLPGTSLEAILDYRISIGHYNGDDPAVFRAQILALANAPRTERTLRKFPDGSIFSIVIQPTNDGGWVSTHEDVTVQQEAEQKIASLAREAELERQRLNAAVTNMPIGLSMFDASKRLITANPQYAEMYRLPEELMKPGTPLTVMLEHRIGAGTYAGPDPDKFMADLLVLIERMEPFRDIIQFQDGRIFSLIFQPMSDGGWVATHEDITDRRKAESKIAHMLQHDALTDLPNRVLVRERIADAVVREGRAGATAVLCIDLDHFKGVNDTLGHPIGDRLLQAAAERLGQSVRDADTVARLSGDEFAIVQVGADQPQGARTLAQRVQEALAAPYRLDGQDIVISASIGIAVAPVDGEDSDRLLKNADIALYRAKADGRATYRFFEAEMDALMQARRALELDLRRALEGEQFELFYQPEHHLKSGRISGCEALLRWRHAERGQISPTEFIPIAEETGLIVPIGEWVLQRACGDAASWPSDIRVAVNLSAVQFRDARLLHAVVAALDTSGLTPTRLELEITESALLADADATVAVLHQLRELGVRIAMDDFGTGYSSLGYLQRFPFDRIKIDRRFVKDINRDGNSLAIIRAVTGLCDSLGIATTAEGVETRDQLERVRAEGCTEVQGFLLARPMPIGDLLELLVERPAKAASAA
jgi:diguanylate cyclase (GGDEF)-like protein